MVILQFIMGFIMGIYLMEILSGHLVTKKVMATLKRDSSHQEEGKDNNQKNPLEDHLG
jgi:hypothetical protein